VTAAAEKGSYSKQTVMNTPRPVGTVARRKNEFRLFPRVMGEIFGPA